MNTFYRKVTIWSSLIVTSLAPAAVLAQLASDEAEPAIDNIVVIGTQASMDSERAEIALTPGGISLIDMEDFRERNVSSLADVLQYVPGIWSSSDSGSDGIFFPVAARIWTPLTGT